MRDDPRVAVLFRTYVWDESSRRAAARLSGQAAGMTLFILIDETRSGPVDTAPYPKIAHTAETFAAYGLPLATVHPAPTLWWNCDYGIYDGVLARPGYDFYFAIEDDVAVNVPLMPLARRMRDEDIEAVVSAGPRAIDGWVFAGSASDMPYPEKSWSTLSTVFVSAGVGRLLFEERLRLGGLRAGGHMTAWPFCETFVSSAMQAHGVRVVPLGTFGDVTHFGNLALHETDPRASQPGGFAHSVLAGDRYIDKALRLFDHHLASGNRRLLAVLRADLLRAGLTEVRGRRVRPAVSDTFGRNLALDRPAVQSSLSGFSRPPKRADLDANLVDAAGATTGMVGGDSGFHTGVEANPWWQVDLGAPHPVGRVRIFNRDNRPERARHLSIMAGAGVETLTPVFRKTDDRVFSGHDDPLDCVIEPPVSARFVRVMLDGTGALNLDEVEVYEAAPSLDPL